MLTKIEEFCKELYERCGIISFSDLKIDDRKKALAIFWNDDIYTDNDVIWREEVNINTFLSDYYRDMYDQNILAHIILEQSEKCAIKKIDKIFENFHMEHLF